MNADWIAAKTAKNICRECAEAVAAMWKYGPQGKIRTVPITGGADSKNKDLFILKKNKKTGRMSFRMYPGSRYT